MGENGWMRFLTSAAREMGSLVTAGRDPPKGVRSHSLWFGPRQLLWDIPDVPEGSFRSEGLKSGWTDTAVSHQSTVVSGSPVEAKVTLLGGCIKGVGE